MVNDTLLSDAELQGILSTGYGELYSILVESGMRYFESTDAITSDGNASYALPSDFFVSIGVDYVASTGRRIALGELMVQERNVYSGASGGGRAHAYALTGSNLTLYPTPASGQSYEHLYVPQPTDLSAVADSTSVDVVTADGEAFLDAYLLVEMLDKEENSDRLGGAIAKRERARERLERWALYRSLNNMRRPVTNSFDPGGDMSSAWLDTWWD